MAGRLIGFYDHPYHGRRVGPWDMWADPWRGDMGLPRRLFDQHFGQGLLEDDLHLPELWRGLVLRPRRQPIQQASGMSEVANTDEQFTVSLDVSHFKPEELSIKTVGNKVIIHGKHEEKQDEHGFIQREFRRTYILPNDVDPDSVKSTLTADGVLAIVAPKNIVEKPSEKVIPIERVSVDSSALSS